MWAELLKTGWILKQLSIRESLNKHSLEWWQTAKFEVDGEIRSGKRCQIQSIFDLPSASTDVGLSEGSISGEPQNLL